MSEIIEVLEQALKELTSYIDDKNKTLEKSISSTDLDDPDYHDYQTCNELAWAINELKIKSEWISTEGELPENSSDIEQVWVDIWVNGERECDVNFEDGKFKRVILDYQGDFSHYEVIEGATHWMIPAPPQEGK